MTTFADMVELELIRARVIHPTPQHNGHEGYAVLLEEVDEFWDQVKAKKTIPALAVEELVQIAAMAQRTAEDVYRVAT